MILKIEAQGKLYIVDEKTKLAVDYDNSIQKLNRFTPDASIRVYYEKKEKNEKGDTVALCSFAYAGYIRLENSDDAFIKSALCSLHSDNVLQDIRNIFRDYEIENNVFLSLNRLDMHEDTMVTVDYAEYLHQIGLNPVNIVEDGD